MRLYFRDDSATEEPTASIEDLEFKVHRNTFEGANHFTFLNSIRILCFYSITNGKMKSFSVKKTPLWMNVTSGSLEAFGGDVSKGDM